MYKILKHIKCPRCKTPHPDLIEIWSGHGIAFEFNPVGAGEYFEGVKEPGQPKRVEGHCFNCGKRWKLRGVILGDIIDMGGCSAIGRRRMV